MEIAKGNSSKFVFSMVAILRRKITTKTVLASIRYDANIQLKLVLFIKMSSFFKRCLHIDLAFSVRLSFDSSGTGVWHVQMLIGK